MAQRKRKSRKPGGGNPFAGRDAEIAGLRESLTSVRNLLNQEREQHANRLQEVFAENQTLANYRNDAQAYATRLLDQAKAAEKRAREIEPRYQREIQFLRDTLHRLTASGFQIEQTYRVVD